MNAYKHLIRPLLFKLNPEATHAMARALLRCPYSRRLFGGQGLFIHDERLRVNLGGLTISNPVGLAAGLWALVLAISSPVPLCITQDQGILVPG